MTKTTVLLGVLLCGAAHATAATLRPITELHGPIVRLSDLFDDAGPQAARALGPGPEPGQTLVVEAPQLQAIAREFGVAWHPQSLDDRIMLQRSGEPLPRGAVIAAMRAALSGDGAGDGQIELGGFEPPIVAPDAHAHVDVEQLDFDQTSGRFAAQLVVSGTDMAPISVRVSGTLKAMETVLVAAHRLDRGLPLAAADLRLARVPASLLHGEAARDAAQADGLAPRRTLAEGQPVLLADLVKPIAVPRGDLVSMSLDQPGLSVSSVGEAEEDGAVGDRIRVMNPVTRAVLLAEVTGPGTVRVAPGSLPLRTGDDAGHSPEPHMLPRLLP